MNRLKKIDFFVLFFLSIYIFFLSHNLLHHNMWRDELEHWLVARDSTSILNLFHNIKYEGHPCLWYLCLFLLKNISRDPVIMQIFHGILASITVFIILKYSPFNNPQKVLMIFGYFFVFEYAVISRNYCLGVLLIFIFLTLYKKFGVDKLVLMSIILSLSVQTHLFVSIIASFLMFYILNEYLTNKKNNHPFYKDKTLLTSIGIFSVSMILEILQLSYGISQGQEHWFSYIDPSRISKYVSGIWYSYIPIPFSSLHFWNSNILYLLYSHIGLIITLVLSFILFIISLNIFKKDLKILITYFLSVTSILLFMYIKEIYSIRHFGYVYIVFISCLWLLFSKKNQKEETLSNNYKISKLMSVFLYFILISQCIAGIYACFICSLFPFSNGKNVAEYINNNKLNNLDIVIFPDYIGASVVGYINNKDFYSLEADKKITFLTQNKIRLERLESLSPEKAYYAVIAKSNKNKKNILLLLNKDIIKPNLTMLKSFNNAIVSDENYNLYIIRPN